jgi:hypothetical protein
MFSTTCLLTVLGESAFSVRPVPQGFAAKLNGFNEVPSVVTKGVGKFQAKLAADGEAIVYELRFDTQGTPTQAHIHVGQRHTNGGVAVFLCQTSTNPDPTGLAPDCAGDSVSGTITAANVIGPASQGVGEGDLKGLLRAMRAHSTYVNLHSDQFPAGELRGQIRWAFGFLGGW